MRNHSIAQIYFWHSIVMYLPKQIPMPSSVVSSIKYDADTKILRIRFVSGLVYNYKGVPETLVQEVLASGSKGRFLNQKIKGKYEFERVES